MPAPSPHADAQLAAAIFAVDPQALGGVRLRAGHGPARDAWLAALRALLPASTAWRRMPGHIGEDRLLGGLDFTATLHSGRPILQRGLLAETDGGVLLLPMAERLGASTQALLCAVLDSGEVRVEREGLRQRSPARVGMVALDEGEADEAPSPALLDRLALHVDLALHPQTAALQTSAHSTPFGPGSEAEPRVSRARALLPRVEAGDDQVQALCATALQLGIGSLRAERFALHVARIAAALDARTTLEQADLEAAARLVLAPRATVLPSAPEDSAEPPPESDTPPDSADSESQSTEDQRPLDDVVLAAALAALPPGLLERLREAALAGTRSGAQGRVGALRASLRRGRPAGLRRAEPKPGVRLNLIATLRAAAPWQPLRRATQPGAPQRISIRREDFHITRHQERQQSTTIFLVDASGSSALHRLAEAKGAIELLLAECYVRRDEVAVIAFRGASADLVLPPTRSLLRAKRSLAGLPGGGGTPLASAIEAGLLLAMNLRQRGATPTLVLLTDGRANVTRAGQGQRAVAEEEARTAARRLRASSIDTLFIDTSPRPQPEAQALAQHMGARYLALPQADSRAMSDAVSAAVKGAARLRN